MTTRQLNHVFPMFRGNVITKPAPVQFGELRTSVRMEIHNTMRVGVFWKNAHGALFVEAPCLHVTGEEALHITYEYEFGKSVKFDARELSNELLQDPTRAERKQLLEGFTGLVNQMQAGGTPPYKLHYTLVVPRTVLEQYGGVLYLNDCDLVVGFAHQIELAIHPFTLEGTRTALAEHVGADRDLFHGYLFIDNSGRHGSRWFNNGIDVIELIPERDNTLVDGVYISNRTHKHARVTTRYLALEEAEKTWGLYRTRGEAEGFGDPTSRHQQMLKDMEQENQRLKVEAAREQQQWNLEIEQLKIESVREKHELEREKRKFEQDKYQLEQDRERLSFHRERLREERDLWAERQKYEMDARSREQKAQVDHLKTLGDILKAVLGVITVGLTIYAAVQKAKK